MGRRSGECGVEEVEVFRDGEIGRRIEEVLEEPDLVGLRPYPVELERRLASISASAAVEFWCEVRVRVRVRVGDFAFDGKFGFEGEGLRVRAWGGGHGYDEKKKD